MTCVYKDREVLHEGGEESKDRPAPSLQVLILRGPSFPHLPLLIAGCVDLEIILLGTRRSVRAGSRSLTLNTESFKKERIPSCCTTNEKLAMFD